MKIPTECTIQDMSDEIIKRCESTGQGCLVTWTEPGENTYWTCYTNSPVVYGLAKRALKVVNKMWDDELNNEQDEASEV